MANRSSVRIIGGAWRGRRVAFAPAAGIRPTPDRVRETLFNWLQPHVPSSRCLDLFAGSGALGLEALSRGARLSVFVEHSAPSAQRIREHLHQFGGEGRVVEAAAEHFLAGPPAAEDAPFDVVFVDPPFGQGWLRRILPLLAGSRWLNPGALVYLESERSLRQPELPAGWELHRSKFAGEVGYHLARVMPRPSQ